MSDAAGLRGGGGRRRRKNPRPSGTFDTAEDAARAEDAAAVEILSSMARTNFEQPATIYDGGGVSPLLAEPAAHGMHQQPSGQYIAQIQGSKGKAALSVVGFKADLTPAERQQVDELLKDMDATDVQAAAILRQISLAGMHGELVMVG